VASVPPEPTAEASRKPAPAPTTTISDSVPDINWSYAVIERQDPGDLSTGLVAFHLGKLVLQGDEAKTWSCGRAMS